MNTALLCLLGFALWTILLVVMVISWRGVLVLKGDFEPHTFPSGSPHGSELYWRLNRAHINAAEGLPIFGVLVLAGVVTGVTDPMFATLCMVVLGARIVQSTVHIAANTATSVSIRVTAQLTQLGSGLWMIVIIAKELL